MMGKDTKKLKNKCLALKSVPVTKENLFEGMKIEVELFSV